MPNINYIQYLELFLNILYTIYRIVPIHTHIYNILKKSMYCILYNIWNSKYYIMNIEHNMCVYI